MTNYLHPVFFFSGYPSAWPPAEVQSQSTARTAVDPPSKEIHMDKLPFMKVITGYFSGIIHVINGVFLVLITGISGHNCMDK